MSRARKPASLKAGRSESKEQLNARHEIEKQLLGSSDKVKIVPEHLDKLAKIYYKFLISELEISGILSNLDIPVLEQTANALSKMRECDEHLDSEGLVVESEDRYGHKQLKENPYVKIKMSYMNQFRNLANQLGLSPASRASLAGKKVEEEEKKEDPLLNILNGRN